MMDGGSCRIIPVADPKVRCFVVPVSYSNHEGAINSPQKSSHECLWPSTRVPRHRYNVRTARKTSTRAACLPAPQTSSRARSAPGGPTRTGATRSRSSRSPCSAPCSPSQLELGLRPCSQSPSNTHTPAESGMCECHKTCTRRAISVQRRAQTNAEGAAQDSWVYMGGERRARRRGSTWSLVLGPHERGRGARLFPSRVRHGHNEARRDNCGRLDGRLVPVPGPGSGADNGETRLASRSQAQRRAHRIRTPSASRPHEARFRACADARRRESPAGAVREHGVGARILNTAFAGPSVTSCSATPGQLVTVSRISGPCDTPQCC